MEIIKNRLIMIKEKSFKYNSNLSSTLASVSFIRNIVKLQEEPEEVTILIALDTKNNVVGFCEVSRGTIDTTFTTGREILKRALIMNATKIILAHNHPSGIAIPSDNDKRVTKKIEEATKLLDIELLDHIIIGENENFSIIFEKEI